MSLFYSDHIDFTKEPLFFGTGRNIARLDLSIEDWITKATDRLQAKLWFPSDFDLSKAAIDFNAMTPELKSLFLKNLEFQQELDSLATRSVLEMFLPITTNPQMERFWVLHAFTESIHSLSYADIVKALPIDAEKEFDTIMINENIQKRAKDIIDAFENLYQMNARMIAGHPGYNAETHKRSFISALFGLNILENGLFDTSFNTTFAFAKNGMMDVPAKIVQKINTDEQSHYGMTVYLINRLKKTNDFKYIFEQDKQKHIDMYKRAYEADLEWIDYTYDGTARLIGINNKTAKLYAQYNTNKIMKSVGFEPFLDEVKENPMKWLSEFKELDNIQVAQKETSGISYLVGAIDKSMTEQDWKEL